MIALFLLGLTGALLSGCQHFNHGTGQDSEIQSMLFTSLDGEEFASHDPGLSSHLRSINNHRPITKAKKQLNPSDPNHLAKKDSPKTYTPDNQKLSNEILAALISQDDLKHAHIRVSGYHGDILIFGEVPNEKAVKLAQNITASFSNVKTVRTALNVGDNLTRSQQTEDSINNTEVKAEIAKLDIAHAHLQVATNSNQVFIVGPLSQEEKSRVQQQLERLPYIDAVYFY